MSAVQAARLFGGLLLQPRLRTGLKAELGAFYPLLLLRPMENDRHAHFLTVLVCFTSLRCGCLFFNATR